MARQIRKRRQTGWIVGLLSVFILVGGEGFFVQSLLVYGAIKPPSSFQWPAGYVSGVVITEDGNFVVPLTNVGRVQIYDPGWHFIRGWQVSSRNFRVECTPQGIIDVFSLDGLPISSFTEDGERISGDRSGRSAADYLSGSTPESTVPTSPVLWVFSSPFLCWFLAAIGGFGWVIVDRRAHHKAAGPAAG